MQAEQKFLQNWFQRVWLEQDSKAIDEMYGGGDIHGLGEQPMNNVQQFKQFHQSICALLTDIHFHIDKLLVQDDWCSCLCTVNALSCVDGKAIVVTGNLTLRIEDNRIQQAYNHFDFMSLWMQLGFLPEDCFEQGLMGKAVIGGRSADATSSMLPPVH